VVRFGGGEGSTRGPREGGGPKPYGSDGVPVGPISSGLVSVGEPEIGSGPEVGQSPLKWGRRRLGLRRLGSPGWAAARGWAARGRDSGGWTARSWTVCRVSVGRAFRDWTSLDRGCRDRPPRGRASIGRGCRRRPQRFGPSKPGLQRSRSPRWGRLLRRAGQHLKSGRVPETSWVPETNWRLR
jgi:hypothetical protein